MGENMATRAKSRLRAMADGRLAGSKPCFVEKEIKDFVAAHPLCLQVVEGESPWLNLKAISPLVKAKSCKQASYTWHM